MLLHQLTIVIPTFNEEKYIWRTLNEIDNQVGVKHVKIIIADAGSTDKTIYLINLFKAKHSNIEIIKGGLPAVGRNAGAKLATTPCILFLDADITFTKRNAILSSVDLVSFMDYDMVSTNPIYKGKWDIRANIMFKLNKYITWFLSKTEPFAIGGFTMVSKKSFNLLGGYDENAKQSEDWLLSKKVHPKKFKLLPNLITQDNRRFKSYGYFSMIKLMWNNWRNRNNINYFYEDKGYWK